MSEKPVDCAIYIRVSTYKQVKEGNGLELQQKKCEAMALIKSWNVVEVFADEGISGIIVPDKRPGFKKLLTEIESGKIKGVIIYRLDRIGRTSKIITDTINYIENLGCEIISCSEIIDNSTPTGKFFLNVMSAMSEFDHKKMLKRLDDGRTERYNKDGDRGGVLIYGYRRNNNNVEIHEYNSSIVKYIYECYSLNMSFTKISNKLNEKNIPSPANKKWYPRSVRRIIEYKDIYLGGRRNNSNFYWSVILSEEYRNINFINKKSKKIKTSEEMQMEKLAEKQK